MLSSGHRWSLQSGSLSRCTCLHWPRRRLEGIHRTITTFLAIGYGRFWGTDGHCLHLYIHQAPVDSSKPMVIQMALMKPSELQDKTKDMNVERELVRRNGG